MTADASAILAAVIRTMWSGPLPLSLGNANGNCVVCGVNCTARTPCVKDNEAIQPTVQQASAKNGTKPARVYMCFCVTDQHYYAC